MSRHRGLSNTFNRSLQNRSKLNLAAEPELSRGNALELVTGPVGFEMKNTPIPCMGFLLSRPLALVCSPDASRLADPCCTRG
jgi:hypothetical protein